MQNAAILCVLIRERAERRGSSTRKADGELQKRSSGFKQQHWINRGAAETQPSCAEMPTDPRSSLNQHHGRVQTSGGSWCHRRHKVKSCFQIFHSFFVTSLLYTRPSGTRWQQFTSSLVVTELPRRAWMGRKRAQVHIVI